MQLSRTLAIMFGIFLPVAETVRRASTWRETPLSLFDDYVLGAILLSAAWFAGRNPRRGQRFLAAAWGIGLGVGYGGIMGQFQRLQAGLPDPAPIGSEWVAAIKCGLMVLGFIALVAALREWPDADRLDSAPARPQSSAK